MNKRVIGILTPRSINENLNTNCEGYPRQVNNLFTATDGCRKYFVRNFKKYINIK